MYHYYCALLGLFVFLLTSCISQKEVDALKENKEYIFPIGAYGKWGFANKNGELVIPYQFEEVDFFSRYGVAVAKSKGKYGLINKTGNWHIRPKYDFARQTCYGNTLVVKKSSKKLIDLRGKIFKGFGGCEKGGCAIYYPISPNKHSIFQNGKYALIYSYYLTSKDYENKIFKRVTDTTDFIYDSVIRFSGHSLIVEQNGHYGFYKIHRRRLPILDITNLLPDEKGKYKLATLPVEIKYDFVDLSYDKTYAVNYAKVNKDGMWGMVGAYGNEVVPLEYYSIEYDRYRGSLALVEYEKDKFGYKRLHNNEEYFKRTN